MLNLSNFTLNLKPYNNVIKRNTEWCFQLTFLASCLLSCVPSLQMFCEQ